MTGRHLITAVGAGLTTFLLVAVLIIELLAVEFSALLGLPVGLLAGLVTAVGLLATLDETSPAIRRALSAYATFGLTVFVLLALSYVNVGRTVLSVDVIVGAGLLAVVVAYVALWLGDRGQPT